MKYTALQAAIEYGGFATDAELVSGMTDQDIRNYFSKSNFDAMFPGEDNTQCGGFSLPECAEAVVEFFDKRKGGITR